MINEGNYSLEFLFDNEAAREELIAVAIKMDIDFDAVDGAWEADELALVAYGSQAELVALAEEHHRLHGGGFSFNADEVIEVLEAA
jgi:hypothetical protein